MFAKARWYAHSIRPFTRRLSLLAASALLGSFSSLNATCLDQVKSWTDAQMAGPLSDVRINALCAGTTPLSDSVAEMAAVEARLWLLGGKTNDTYAKSSLFALKALTAQWQRAKETHQVRKIGFQAKYAFLDAYQILTENGIGTDDAAFRAAIKNMAAESMEPTAARGTSNGDAFNAAGTVLALKLWPDLDAKSEWTRYVKEIWSAWAVCQDTTENSLNYNDLYLQMMIFIAQRAEEVRTLKGEHFLAQFQGTGARMMFNRFRDQVTGTGAIPVYGDAGDASGQQNLDAWPAAFAWAGARWKDGTFAWAGEQRFDFVRHGKNRALYLYLLTYADAWSDRALTVTAPPVGSALLTRVTEQNPKSPDQIVLAPDRKQLSPFFDTNLFVGGSHPHDAQTGAVALYQVKGTMFLRGLGYDCSTSSEASLFLINRPDQPFPWRGMPAQDIWYEAQIPTDALDKVLNKKDPHYGLTVLNQPEWRWETRDKAADSTAWISQVRLVAADGSETMLNKTDNATDWPKDTLVTDGPTPGTKALQFVAKPNVRGNDATVYCVPKGQAFGRYFDAKQFPYVRFYWKAHSLVPFDQQICIFREMREGQGFGASAWDHIFRPTVTAEVNSKGNSHYGTYTMRNYMGLGDVLNRRMVQLADGTMIIMDTVTAAADHDGDAAGPIWQLLTPTAPTLIGENAYDATGFFNSITRTSGADHLLVYMETAKGRSFGAPQPPEPLWGKQVPYAAYAKSAIRKGQPTSYVTVLLPHDGSMDATALAGGISIQRTDANTATVTIKGNPTLGSVQVTLGAKNAWNVTTGKP